MLRSLLTFSIPRALDGDFQKGYGIEDLLLQPFSLVRCEETFRFFGALMAAAAEREYRLQKG